MNKNKIYILGMVLTVILCVGCNKTITVKDNPNLLLDEDIFKEESMVTSAVNGVYVKMRGAQLDFSNAGMSVFGALLADELTNTTNAATYLPFMTNNLLSNNSNVLNNFWRNSYANIYTVNAIIEGLEKYNYLSEAFRNQVIGEMKFIRAFHYFYLVNLFGDVPLVLQTNYGVNQSMPRTPSEKVFTQLVDDLTSAKNLMSSSYFQGSRTRPNSACADLLLSRVYLYQRQWELAEREATTVIGSGSYHLETIANTFLNTSQEILWQIAPPNQLANTEQGRLFIPSNTTSRPTFALSSSLLSKISNNDQRLSGWIKFNTNGGIRYYYPFKFKQRVVSDPLQEYNIALRFAEAYLIRAEARARLEDIDGAQKDLNNIRQRAGLDPTTASTSQEVIDAISEERRIEFFCEWGHRWLDLKRTGEASSVLSIEKGQNWQRSDTLLPIPFSEINLNPFLKQNNGY